MESKAGAALCCASSAITSNSGKAVPTKNTAAEIIDASAACFRDDSLLRNNM
jgi:hypothetical protein